MKIYLKKPEPVPDLVVLEMTRQEAQELYRALEPIHNTFARIVRAAIADILEKP